MEHRRLGRSGLRVSEITYRNWLTHGELVAGEAAVACVHAALEADITTFDTADVYAQGAAEELLGKALRGVRRESVEIATKVCLPTGDGPNDRGLSRKHIVESCHASLRRRGRAPRFIRRVLGDPLLERVQRLRPLADEAGLSMAQLAIAWTLQNNGVSSAVIGASRPEQVSKNAAAAGIRLEASILARIDQLLGDLIDTDPARTAQMMAVKPAWVQPAG